MALRIASSQQTAAASRTTRRCVAPRPSQRRSVVVRAEEATKAAPAKWVEPTLNTDTPSPIFGGSKGGLLRAAQASIC
jgi:hypothetical protein